MFEALWCWVSSNADTINKLALAIVAVVSVVVSPFVQWFIARRQVNQQAAIAATQAETQCQIAARQIADSVAAKRQAWIDDLRRDLALFLTHAARLEEIRHPTRPPTEAERQRLIEQFAASSFAAHEVGVRIRLRLNPKEDDHNELKARFQKLGLAVSEREDAESEEQRQAAEEKFAAGRDAVLEQAQVILKKEWERVKRGDI